MATATASLAKRAEAIFTDLGYAVERDGTELRAERKWRVVHVTPVEGQTSPDVDGALRCFVTHQGESQTVRERLRQADPDYEWAVIEIDERGDYEVCRAPTTPLT